MALRSLCSSVTVRSRIACLSHNITHKPTIFCRLCYQTRDAIQVSKNAQRIRWNPFTWYNAMLDKYPMRTKMITSAILYGLGDIFAQKGTRPKDAFDKKRCLRASIYGFAFMAPLAHYHFAFLEWLVVKKYPLKSAVMPFAKMAIDQFGYWTPGILLVYHTSMGAMEGLNLEQIKERLRLLYWPSIKANWMIWPAVMLVNFKFVPVSQQLNVCLIVSLGWATFLSYLGGTASKREDHSTQPVCQQ